LGCRFLATQRLQGFVGLAIASPIYATEVYNIEEGMNCIEKLTLSLYPE
jgi:hypothetical protein